MKITFLGTGTSHGIPMLLSDEPVNFSKNPKDKRTRSSVLISWKNANYLIDCSPDFRAQVLNHKITDIDGILFTHEHFDHIGGLDDIRAFCNKNGPMPIYALERVMKSLKKRYEYIFAEENRYPNAATVIPTIIDEDQRFELAKKEVISIKITHGKLPILGYRIDKFAYLTDLKFIENQELEKLQKLKVLVISAIRIDPHPTHLNLEGALSFIELVNPERAYLTHISHRLGFHEEVTKNLPKNVFLAYDGLNFKV